MSKKKKKCSGWSKQWFEVELYLPVGWLKRKKFYVWTTTHDQARRKLLKACPTAEVLVIAPLGI